MERMVAVDQARDVRVWIGSPEEDGLIRERMPTLLAAARRLLEEPDARAVVEEAAAAARSLMLEFRTPSPGVWLQGLVVGLSVARAARARHSGESK